MWYVLVMTTGGNETGELATITAERQKFQGFLAAAKEELAATGVVHEQVTLRREINRIQEQLTRLNVREHELLGKIKRAVGPGEAKCPTCGRYLPSGTILSEALRAQLSK